MSEPETAPTPALSRIETIAKLIAAQVVKDPAVATVCEDAGGGRLDLEEVIARVANAAISDSPLRFPDELHMEPTPAPQYIDIVFDGPPGPTSGRFVEVEDVNGRSIKVGGWLPRHDGMHVLRIPMIVPGPFYELHRGGSRTMVAPTVHEARLLEAAGALALKAGASDNPKVAGLGHAFAAEAAKVVEEARFTRAAAVIGREILFTPGAEAPVITEDELFKATAITTAYLGRSTNPLALDAEASDILVRAYADRMSTLIDLVDAMVMRDAKGDQVMCAHCGKHYPGGAGIRAHVETCAMSRVVIDLRQAKEDHARAAELLAQVWHAATGTPWGDGPTRGIVEDVVDVRTHHVDLATHAWGVIANVSGGDWTQQSDEWRAAAARWRDEYTGDPKPAELTPSIPLGLARRMYNAYGDKAGWRTFDDREMPSWANVGDVVRARWAAAAQEARVAIGELQAGAVRGFVDSLKDGSPERVTDAKVETGEDGTVRASAKVHGLAAEALRGDPPASNVRPRGGATRTMALMEITPAAYTEIKGKLEAAGYDHAIHVTRGERETLDLHGVGLVSE